MESGKRIPRVRIHKNNFSENRKNVTYPNVALIRVDTLVNSIVRKIPVLVILWKLG